MNVLTSKRDRHLFDRFLRPIANPLLMVGFAVLATVTGVLLSCRLQDWSWFGRMGSFVVLAGLLLVMSPMFSRGIYMSQSKAGTMAEVVEGGEIETTTVEDRRMGRAILLGVIISIIGTLISAFGDLVGILG